MRGDASGFAEYAAADQEPTRRTLLHLAALLGDLMATDLTVVGGLVPSLIIPVAREPHCGTLDVDVGLSLALRRVGGHAAVPDRLRENGFRPTTDEDGNIVPWRWRTPGHPAAVTIDFLMPARGADHDVWARLTPDFAPVRTPGLQLVRHDWLLVDLRGSTLAGEDVRCRIRVCGPGAFVVLKARALRERRRPKDAYDLHYVLKHLGGGVEDVATALRGLTNDDDARQALAWLAEDYAALDSIGPVQVAAFLQGARDDELQADARGRVPRLLSLLD